MRRRSRSRPFNTARGVGVLLLTLVIGELVAWAAAEALVVSSNLTDADAIAVLAGSSTYLERARRAAQLFHEGRAPKVLLTNDNLQSGWSAAQERNPFFVERARDELILQGVPPEKIELLTGPVSSTHDEAERLRDYARQNGLGSILIVTSAYQSRRALWTMYRVFDGTDVKIGLMPVQPGQQSPRPATWWRSRLGWQMVPGEYLKMIYYRVKY